MAVDAMDLDSTPPTTIDLPERKRKHKSQDSTSSTKKRKSDEKKSKSKSASSTKSKNAGAKQTQTIPDSPYTLTTATLYLPLSPISISPTHALASLLAEHLSPLLLTYYPPLKGIVLAYSNASISSTPPNASAAAQSHDPSPQPLTLATSANEYGVLYVYLTATFLVFRPQRGQILEGWVNVQSEGFLGAVVLNLFSVGIERKRLPTTWKWIPPGEEAPTTNKTDDESESDTPTKNFDPEKEHFTPVSLASDANPLSETTPNPALEGETEEDESAEGYFQSVSGHRVRGTVRFRVLDVDVIPGTDRERGFMSIEGSMLSPEEEEGVVEDEKNGILSTATPRRPAASAITMSGALPIAPAPATVTVGEPEKIEEDQEQEQEPEPAVETPSKPKVKKSKSDDKEKSEKKERKSKSESDDKEKKEKKSKSKKVKGEK